MHLSKLIHHDGFGPISHYVARSSIWSRITRWLGLT